MSVFCRLLQSICTGNVAIAASMMLSAYSIPAAAASDWEKREGDVLRYAGYTLAFAQDCGLDSRQFLPQVMLYIGWTTENEREAKAAGNYLKRMIAEGKARNAGSDWPCTVVKGALPNKVKQFASANKKRSSLGEGMEYAVFNHDPAVLFSQDFQFARMLLRAQKCSESTYKIIGHMYRVNILYTAVPSTVSERFKMLNKVMDALKDKEDEQGTCKSAAEEENKLMDKVFQTLHYLV